MSDLDLLMDAARSEAKRWGYDKPNVFLVAIAARNRWPDEFEKTFSDDDYIALVALLERQVEPPADEFETLQRELADDDGSAEILATIHAAVTPHKAEEIPAAKPAQQAARAEAEDEFPFAFLDRVTPDSRVRGASGCVDEVIAHLAAFGRHSPLVVGRSGSGKTSLIGALAARMDDPSYTAHLAGTPVYRLSATKLHAAARVEALTRLVVEVKSPMIVVLDDLEVFLGVGATADFALVAAVRRLLESAKVFVAATIDEALLGKTEALVPELLAEFAQLPVALLPQAVLEETVTDFAGRFEEAHDVVIPAAVVAAALAPPASSDAQVHPGLALDRLDRASVRAALRGAKTVSTLDLGLGDDLEVTAPDKHALAASLRERVLGQDSAIERVAERLALTRARLDLRDERPDGVFLFLGPTGVGKTELARAINAEVFGPSTELIRLDMSEYSHDWAVSRLVGPQPGYSGYTEPDSWLTTRVQRNPQCVILLDEIEKAHPTVWNVFLQVFDAGRLSDARTAVTDFSRTVVVMTSNIGASAFTTTKLGFGNAASAASPDDRTLDALRDLMAPELINRIDEVAVFAPLDQSAILRIAHKEVRAASARLRTRGYELTVDDDVVELLASSGYDKNYGARHLQRNIERLLLQPLTSVQSRSVRASIDDGKIVWRSDGM